MIDKDGNVRHQVVNDLPFGRNVDGMLRVVDTLPFYEKHGDICPTSWQNGEDSIKLISEKAPVQSESRKEVDAKVFTEHWQWRWKSKNISSGFSELQNGS